MVMRQVEFKFRPIGHDYPGVRSRDQQRSRFKAHYADTEELLRREIEHLAPALIVNAVIQLDLAESDIRLDGLPRANARPASDAVVLSFESVHGPLRYATDTFFGDSKQPGWQHNLRAIALSLEALRKVDRYGVSKRGEQYRGWKELGSGNSDAAPTLVEACTVLARATDGDPATILAMAKRGEAEALRSLYRKAARASHPDHGGEGFYRLQPAWETIQREVGS